VVGYSRLMTIDEAGTLAALTSLRKNLVNPKISEHNGRIFKLTGDGMLIEFPSVVSAVACAVDIQSAMRTRNATEPAAPIEFRIGVNLGDIIVEEGDIFGDGVNVAARLETIAPVGGIAVSQSARDHVGKRLDLTFEDMGERRLKNIDAPVRVYSIALDQLPTDSGGSAREGERPSVAVLPFVNMSGDPEQEYFSDGITEDIITDLSKVSALSVVARNTAFTFKGKVRDVAQELGVSHVLEGSVRRAGNKLRITGQLIHAADGTHLWSERYDRELSDIFAVQDEISSAIVGVLRVKLSSSVAQRYTPNLAAYEAFLKARYLGAKIAPESMERSQRCYEQASRLDPAFALPHVGLGHCWIAANMFGSSPAREAFAAARTEAHKALQIDPALPEAHALLGMLAAAYDRDWIAAERHFDFPHAKQVSFATFRPMYGWYQFLRGNPEQTIELARRAIDEDPLDVWPRMNLQAALQAAGREAEALEQLDKVLELDEHQVVALVAKAMIHAEMGDLAQALLVARRAYATAPWYPDVVAVLGGLLHRNGDVAESRSLEQTLAPAGAAPLALFHLLCGDVDRGADWAESAIDEHDQSITVYLRFVASKPLRASPRWPKIARMLNLAN